MKFNWKVRFKNRVFWLAVIPSILLIAQVISGIFGFDIAVDAIGEQAALLVNSIFSFLFIIGLVNDPTTDGLEDSEQAMTYSEPRRKYVE